jgi:choline-sulfatase
VAAIALYCRLTLYSRQDISHVVLISIDTCRPDHLGCYGHTLPTSPNLDALARESVVFQNAYSPVPLTLPAHSSMMTGLIPPHHRVHDNDNYRLEDINVTLAELLKDNGFATAGVAGAVVLDSMTGIAQGFDVYDDRLGENIGTSYILERRADAVSDIGIGWLEANRDGKAFLFLHYYDPHETYDPPEPHRTIFGKRLYDGEIAFTDHSIGRVIERLKALGIYDTTLLIVTADHGEMLGEHGETSHGFFIYQSAIKVPLIIKLPGKRQNRNIADVVGLVDIVPTVCSVLGIEPAVAMDGIDLTPCLTGRRLPSRDTPLYCESLYATKYNANGLYGIVTDQWKYINTTRPELYNLHKDPSEANDMAAHKGENNTALQRDLEEILDSRRRDLSKTMQHHDVEVARKLASIGYVTSSSVDDSFVIDPAKKDPKDLIIAHAASCQIYGLIMDKEFEKARKLSNKLIRQNPDFYPGHFHLGSLEMINSNYTEAISHFTTALEKVPMSTEVHMHLGHSRYALLQLDSAGDHFRRVLELWPYHVDALSSLGNVLVDQGKLDEAIHHLRKAISLGPDDPGQHNDMARVLFELGKPEEAIRHARESVRLNPDVPHVHSNLAFLLSTQGKMDEANHHGREAIRLDPDEPSYYSKLAIGLEKNGQPNEAISSMRASLRLKNDDAMVHQRFGTLLVRQGRTKEGVYHLEEAVRLEPDNAEHRRHLSLALTEQGKAQ